jgi:hypothetical protein
MSFFAPMSYCALVTAARMRHAMCGADPYWHRAAMMSVYGLPR